MKSFIKISIFICYTLFIFFNQNVLAQPQSNNWNEVMELDNINAKNNIIAKIKTSPEVQQFHRKSGNRQATGNNLMGKLRWNESQRATYEDGTTAILTPIDTREKNRSLTLVSILDEADNPSISFLFDMQPQILRGKKAKHETEAFSGKLAFYTLKGEVVQGGEYQNGRLINPLAPAQFGRSKSKKRYWKCVSNCMLDVYGGVLGAACFVICKKCAGSPGWLTCGGCVACAVGGGIYCLIKCK